jgi:2,4-dienoyl-CoA reductase-like NADH-dependent reductase (Old Yellow Enzyme family)
MTDADIDEVIASFARGAVEAQKMGCDAVELHRPRIGYLFDQFFWTATNKRDDRYGGDDIAQRGRFAAELRRRRAQGGQGRTSPSSSASRSGRPTSTTPRSRTIRPSWSAGSSPLSDAGVDVLPLLRAALLGSCLPEEDDRNLAGWTKHITAKPTITVGSVGLDRDLMEDFVAGDVRAHAQVDE